MSGALQAVFQNQRSFIAAPGQNQYCSPGTYSWVAPSGITKVSIIVIGRGGAGGGGTNCCPRGGGGGGGGLAYKNCVTVTPGTSYSFVVGGASSPTTTSALGLTANKGNNGLTCGAGSGGSATNGVVNYQGGTGRFTGGSGGGGGGAAGYTANGQTSCGNVRIGGNSGDGNLGGVSFGTAGGAGGGTSLISSSTTVPQPPSTCHQGAVGAAQGGGGGGNGAFGGGGTGGTGGIRVLWGPGRAYPNTNTGNV